MKTLAICMLIAGIVLMCVSVAIGDISERLIRMDEERNGEERERK